MSAGGGTRTRTGGRTYDVEAVRSDFPVLHQQINGHPLVYLDNAASAQRPRQVIEAVARFYERDYANIHRGVHTLSQRATERYEEARRRTARFIGAGDPREIVFVRGTTEAINLVAWSFVRPRLGPGDEVLITELEHHSNIVPWQLVCRERGARLVAVPVTEAGTVRLEDFDRLIGPRTRFVSVADTSNALGTVNPVREIVSLAHERGVPVLVDGAQAVPHRRVDVGELGCDFFAFSGHKVYGPSGIGVLYGRAQRLEEMPPYQGGGEMIRRVSLEDSEFAGIPHRFEAGTPNIAGAVGLGAAIEYLEALGMDRIAAWEGELLRRATASLREIPEVRVLGDAPEKAAVVSFVVDGVHPHDVGTVLDSRGVAVRAGHHCAQPLMERLGVPATVRASFALYNTEEEIERLAEAVRAAVEIFR
ncbi:MAG: cysteine desulfurase [Acidobacteria bacterium]|nr:MAG: cysteine desulfurase [Acidobacteriota bacterium]